jgi:hypothetical protein
MAGHQHPQLSQSCPVWLVLFFWTGKGPEGPRSCIKFQRWLHILQRGSLGDMKLQTSPQLLQPRPSKNRQKSNRVPCHHRRVESSSCGQQLHRRGRNHLGWNHRRAPHFWRWRASIVASTWHHLFVDRDKRISALSRYKPHVETEGNPYDRCTDFSTWRLWDRRRSWIVGPILVSKQARIVLDPANTVALVQLDLLGDPGVIWPHKFQNM